jgi:alkylated DNA repair protein alkB family protein 6
MNSEDGPCYHPVIATISLGCYTVLNMYPKAGESLSEPEFSLLLEPGSCLILTGEYYTDYLHGIRETLTDDLSMAKILNLNSSCSTLCRTRTCTRISLTFRKHNNVKNFKFLRL